MLLKTFREVRLMNTHLERIVITYMGSESCAPSPHQFKMLNTADWGLTKKQECISYSSDSWKSEIRAPAWSRSGEDPFLGGIGPTPQCPHVIEKERERALWYPLYKETKSERK